MFKAIVRAFRRLWPREEPPLPEDRSVACSPASFMAQLSAERPKRLEIAVRETELGAIQWRFSFTIEGTLPEYEERDRSLTYTLPFLPQRFRELAGLAVWIDLPRLEAKSRIIRIGEIKDPVALIAKQTAP